MLKQTVERPNWNDGLILAMVTLSLIWGVLTISFINTDVTSTSNLSILEISEKLNLPNVGEVNTLSFGFAISNVENTVSKVIFNYGAKDQRFGIDLDSQGNYRVFTPDMKHIPVMNRIPVTRFRCYGIRDSYANVMQLFSPLQTRFENLFRSIEYLGPLREYPRHHYAWQGKHSPGVGKHGEDMVTALFSGRIQLRALDEQIPKWLQRLDLIGLLSSQSYLQYGKGLRISRPEI